MPSLEILAIALALPLGLLILASMLRRLGIGRRLEDVHPSAPEYQGVSDAEMARWGVRRRG